MSLTEEMAVKLALAERQLEALTTEVARNDDKMRRSQQRELRLLQADDLGPLIGEMLLGLRASYGLDYVSVVLLPDTDIASAILLAERIHKAVSREPYELPGGDSVQITASIGIDGVCPDPKADDLKTIGDSLLARVDVALHRAKSGGRNQIAVDEG
jgi:hypothetical protein